MAGITIGWGAFVDIIGMAIRTRSLNMRAGQLEGSHVVVETCRQPSAGRMAAAAVRTQQARVRILIRMTGITRG